MPWKEVTKMTLLQEFIHLAMKPDCNLTSLCKRYGISRKTAYKWIHRYETEGTKGLKEKSRRPKNSPTKTNIPMEQAIIDLRQKQPEWGGRKLRQVLLNCSKQEVPAASTINGILKRKGLISAIQSEKHHRWQRFEAEKPNLLWQMDFKGHFPIDTGRCHPLTVLDDHSRFNLGLFACLDERTETVQNHLTQLFTRFGLPDRILADNGSPWGCQGNDYYTKLSVWLLLLGIQLIHGRPLHPQTTGKDERFHRTLKAELLQHRWFKSIRDCQEAFDQWRDVYNLERPHESLGMQTPVSRYKVSNRTFPKNLPAIEYNISDIIRTVDQDGIIYFKGKHFKAGKAFRGQKVALRTTESEGIYNLIFYTEIIKTIDLNGYNDLN